MSVRLKFKYYESRAMVTVLKELTEVMAFAMPVENSCIGGRRMEVRIIHPYCPFESFPAPLNKLVVEIQCAAKELMNRIRQQIGGLIVIIIRLLTVDDVTLQRRCYTDKPNCFVHANSLWKARIGG